MAALSQSLEPVSEGQEDTAAHPCPGHWGPLAVPGPLEVRVSKKTRLVLVWPLLKALWALWASLLTRKRGWQNDTPNFTQGPT